jgi:hypothetical protein
LLSGGLVELPRLGEPARLLELPQRRSGRLADDTIERARIKAGFFQLPLRLLYLFMMHLLWGLLALFMMHRLLALLTSLPLLLLHVGPRTARPRRRRGLLAECHNRHGQYDR